MPEKIQIQLSAKDMTKAAFRSVNGNMAKMKRSAAAVAASLGPLAGAASVAGLVALGKRSVDAADGLAKMSKRLGTSVEALGEYQLVAKKAGIEFRTLTMGWQRMTRRIAEAANGTGEAKLALQELGLSAENLNQLAPEEQFERLADAIMAVENPAERVRLAMKLFDSEGVSLIQAMQGGSKAIREIRQEMIEYGRVTSEQAKKAEEAADKAAEFDAAVTGLTNSITFYLLPALTSVTDLFASVIKDFGDSNAGVSDLRSNVQGFTASILSHIPAFQALSMRLMEQSVLWRANADAIRAAEAEQEEFDKTNKDTGNTVGITNQQLALASSLYKKFGDQVEILNTEMAVLDDLLEKQLISYEVYQRAMDDVQRRMNALGQTTTTQMGLAKSAAEAAASSLQSSFTEAIFNTKQELIDLASVFRSVLGILINFGLNSVIGSIFKVGGSAATGGLNSAVPVGGGGTTIEAININATSTLNTDPMSIRRLAEQVQDELIRVGNNRGSGS